MKTTFLRIALIFCVSFLALALFGARKTEEEGGPRDSHPGLVIMKEIATDKWQAIKRILDAEPETANASPRGKLYRIRIYDGQGNFKELGDLPEKMLVEDFPNVGSGFKGHAIQIGVGVIEDVDHYPAPGPSPSSTPPISMHSTSHLEESKKMEGEVNKVLQRRESSPSPGPSGTPVISMHSKPHLEESKKMEEEVNKVLQRADSSPSPFPSSTPFISMHFKANLEESKKMVDDVNKVLQSSDTSTPPKR